MDYYASGKLLLFGEYLVLKGAKSLSIPLKYGQKMKVVSTDQDEINWVSSVLNEEWFSARFTNKLELIESTDSQIASTLLHLLQMIRNEKQELFSGGLEVQLAADFPLEWGFGSSSTLISLLAQWSDTDPFKLLENSFGGSGYDVACATAASPILFESGKNSKEAVSLSEKITSKLLFVYSGKKQKSKNEVLRFEEIAVSEKQVAQMSNIIDSVIACERIEKFEVLMGQSEQLLSEILALEQIEMSTFRDYPFSLKSLGAWGGDFFMATYRNEKEAKDYFSKRGYRIQFNYDQIIKQ